MLAAPFSTEQGLSFPARWRSTSPTRISEPATQMIGVGTARPASASASAGDPAISTSRTAGGTTARSAVGRGRPRARRRDQDEPGRQGRERGDDAGGVLVGENPQDEADPRLAEDVAQGHGEGARAGRIVGAVQHEKPVRAPKDLKATRPPRAREPVANRRFADAKTRARR